MKKFLYLISFLYLAGCSSEKLSDFSVVDSNFTHHNTELDQWIQKEITIPYGIEVQYRWDKNSSERGNFNFPADVQKVQSVLQAIKTLWLDIYTLPNLGGKDFFKGKNPIRIYMYGGKNIDARGVELIYNTQATTAEMYIYNVNDFDPKDYEKVYVLMRSVHHQFAKRLLSVIPSDRDNFLKISQERYRGNTEFIATLGRGNDRRFIGLSSWAHKRGAFSLFSLISAENDFAEIISLMLTSSQNEIENALKDAQEPYDSSAKEVEAARKSYQEITQKHKMVDDYFRKQININLRRMQTISVQQIQNYVK